MSDISTSTSGADVGGSGISDAQAEMLAVLWERHYSTNVERIGLLETAAVGLLENSLDENHRSEALIAAHKLAGSLGTFGLDDGTRVARVAEEILKQEHGDARALAEAVVDLISIVRSSKASEQSPQSRSESIADSNNSQELMPPASEVGSADEEPGGVTLLISQDIQLRERMQVAAAARGQALAVVDSADAATVEHSRGSIAVVLVDMDLPDGGGLAALNAMQDSYVTARRFALAQDPSFWKRIEVARAGSSGYLRRTDSPKRILEQAALSSWRTGVHSATVVALDDDPMQHDLLEAMLGNSIFELKATSDPLDFWELLESSVPDAVLLDLRMPWLDGLTICRAIRAEPRFQHLPVLVLTGETDKNVVAEMFDAGADDYVAKPINGLELRARLMSHVERKRLVTNTMDVDALTGLLNRARSEEKLADLIGIAGRQGESVSIALVRIDEIERITALSGHVTADVLASALSGLLAEHLRAEDVVGRWSSEEFVVGMYGAESQQSLKRLESMLEAFSERDFIDLEGKDIEASFSAGLAEFPRDGVDAEQVLGAAERALHKTETARAMLRTSDDVDADGDCSLEQVDVVVVDDDEVLSDLLVHTLEANGYSVRHLGDGLEAVELLGNGLLRTRVVLLDVGLPGLDGFDVLRSLRNSGALGTTEVIMLTARSGSPETVSALDLGAVDFVSKPFNVAVLLGRIEKVLKRVP